MYGKSDDDELRFAKLSWVISSRIDPSVKLPTILIAPLTRIKDEKKSLQSEGRMPMLHSRTIRLERHERIGHLIQKDASTLIDRWTRRVFEEQPKTQRVHHDVLLDHLPAFLWSLGTSLSESDEETVVKHQITAMQHGEQRWANGWSLPELIRDYQLLRTITFEYLYEVLDGPMRFREVLAINLAFDESIASSVGIYVKSREEVVREIERERVEKERQREEDRLRTQAEALKELDQRKDQFLAVLGHELRGPLAPMRNAIQLLTIKGEDPGVLARARDIIDRQTLQMTRLVDGLLDASRIAQGKAQLKFEWIDLVKLVQATSNDHRVHMESLGLSLLVEAPVAPVLIHGDSARLTQVLTNLLQNSAKFTDPGGKVTVRLRIESNVASLQVEDTGVGIAAGALPKLFEAFSQVDATVERSTGGLGLGLSVVKGFVSLHGGSVKASSDGPGRGSIFTVQLPLNTEGR